MFHLWLIDVPPFLPHCVPLPTEEWATVRTEKSASKPSSCLIDLFISVLIWDFLFFFFEEGVRTSCFGYRNKVTNNLNKNRRGNWFGSDRVVAKIIWT